MPRYGATCVRIQGASWQARLDRFCGVDWTRTDLDADMEVTIRVRYGDRMGCGWEGERYKGYAGRLWAEENF